MAEYYRTEFSISKPGLEGIELLNATADVLLKWGKESFGSGDLTPGLRNEWIGERGRLRARRYSDEELGTFSLVWERPAPQYAASQWRLSVRLATAGDDVEADIEVQGVESHHTEPDEEYLAKLPTVPTRLLDEFNCSLGGKRLTTQARLIDNADEASLFIRDELFSPDRSTPLVVVSQDSHGTGIDVGRLQEKLLGLAVVVSYDHDTAWNVSKDLPRPLRCYDGAVRLYSPGCSPCDVSQQNPYWLLTDAQRLQEGRDRLWLMLRDECVIRVSRHARRRLFSRVRERLHAVETERLEVKLKGLERKQFELEAEIEQRRSELESQVATRRVEPEDVPSAPLVLEEELKRRKAELESEMDSVLAELTEDFFSTIDDNPTRRSAVVRTARAFYNKSQRLKLEIDSRDATIKHLECENERLRADLSNNGRDVTSRVEGNHQEGPSAFEQSFRPKTVREAVEHAHLTLKSLRFLPTAFESAEQSGFRRPEEVYEKLARLDECARERAKGSLRVDVAGWLKRCGVDFAAGESERVDAQFRLERTFYDHAQEGYVYMPAHVKIGRGDLRLHVNWQDGEGKWLVGYVGPHLRTARFD